MSEAILEYRKVQKAFYGVPVLKEVSFSLQKGHILGLVGENGAGKSTLMNVLGGIFPYDGGEVLIEGNVYEPKNPKDATKQGIAFIHQELNLFTNLSIAENIFITNFPQKRFPFIDRKKIKEKTTELLRLLDLPLSPDTVVESLSPGERQLIEIAKALSIDSKIIIFDEPTTSLTPRETEKLFQIIARLKAQGISMIYISHELQDIYRLCDHIVVLRDGEVVGNGTVNELAIDEMVTLMVGRKMEQMFPKRNSEPSHVIYEVKNLSQTGIVEKINFTVRAGEVVGISGLMGSGRTELARILFGLDPYEQGEVMLNGSPMGRLSPMKCIQHSMAFLTENRKEEGLLMDKSIPENLAMVSLSSFVNKPSQLINQKKLKEEIGQLSKMMKIGAVNVQKQIVQNLSGGNQQKVVIGKWMYHQPSIFILDEPTRGIDVGAKYEVYKLMNQLALNGTALLMISSDIEELIGMCDRILVMRNGEISGSFKREQFDREHILTCALGGSVHGIA